MDRFHTRHQVPRSAGADKEVSNKLYLIKASEVLHATYQIRTLTDQVARTGKKLILKIRRTCKPHKCLRQFIAKNRPSLTLERYD